MPQKIIGLDFDKRRILAVELSARLGEISFVNSWQKELDNGLYEQIFGFAPPLEERDLFEFFSDEELENAEISISLPARLLYYHELELPFSDFKKIRQVVPLEAEGYFPFSLDGYLLEYPQPVSFDHTSQVLAFALEKDRFSELLRMFEQMGIDPAFCTAEGLSLVLFEQSQPVLWLLVKAKSTILIGAFSGLVFLYRRIPLGWEELKEKGISDDISQTDISLNSLSEQKKKIFYQWADEMLKHISSTVHWLERFDKNRSLPPKFEKLILAGKFPAMLLEYLKEALDLEVARFQIPSFIKLEANIGEFNEPELAEALGLALCRIKREARRLVNFRKGEFAWKAEYQIPYRKLIFPAVVLTAVLVLGLVKAGGERSLLKKQSEEIKKQMISQYRRYFPSSQVIDPYRQLVGAYQSAQSKLDAYSELLKPSALSVMSAMAEQFPEEVELIITRFNYSGSKVRIEGETEDFATTKEFVDRLGQVEFFKKVSLEDTRSIPSGKVKFSVLIELASPQEKVNE